MFGSVFKIIAIHLKILQSLCFNWCMVKLSLFFLPSRELTLNSVMHLNYRCFSPVKGELTLIKRHATCNVLSKQQSKSISYLLKHPYFKAFRVDL
jgi:hypothetical protein